MPDFVPLNIFILFFSNKSFQKKPSKIPNAKHVYAIYESLFGGFQFDSTFFRQKKKKKKKFGLVGGIHNRLRRLTHAWLKR